MLRGVVEEGTGVEAQVPGYMVAGKTGTAAKPDPVNGGYSDSRYVASFVGFAPAQKPAVRRARDGRRAARHDLGRHGRRAGVSRDRPVRAPVPPGPAGRAGGRDSDRLSQRAASRDRPSRPGTAETSRRNRRPAAPSQADDPTGETAPPVSVIGAGVPKTVPKVCRQFRAAPTAHRGWPGAAGRIARHRAAAPERGRAGRPHA